MAAMFPGHHATSLHEHPASLAATHPNIGFHDHHGIMEHVPHPCLPRPSPDGHRPHGTGESWNMETCRRSRRSPRSGWAARARVGRGGRQGGMQAAQPEGGRCWGLAAGMEDGGPAGTRSGTRRGVGESGGPEGVRAGSAAGRGKGRAGRWGRWKRVGPGGGDIGVGRRASGKGVAAVG